MEPQQRTPFISPLVPLKTDKQSDSGHMRLNILVIILMLVFLSGMGFFVYQATQPLSPKTAASPTQNTK